MYVHGDEVGDGQGGGERGHGHDDVGAAGAQDGGLEEAVEDADARRGDAPGHAQVERLVQDLHGQVEQQLNGQQIPRLAAGEQVDEAAARVVQQEQAGLAQARGGRHGAGEGPDGGLRVAGDEDQRVAAEGRVTLSPPLVKLVTTAKKPHHPGSRSPGCALRRSAAVGAR